MTTYASRIRRKYERVGRSASSRVDLYRRAVEDGVLPVAAGLADAGQGETARVSTDGGGRRGGFPPSAAALDDREQRSRRLFRWTTPLGGALAVVGVVGGLHGTPVEWAVAACGAAQVGLGGGMLLHYRRIAADRRYFAAADQGRK